jgi:hypothetical protein
MATNDWDDDDDFDFEDQGQNNQGSNDGDLVKKLRKALRAKEKENKDLAERFESVSKVQREQIVNQVLNQKGVNPKAARLILKDLDSVNEEAVNGWLDDNADLFGLTVQKQEDPQQQLDRAALRQQDVVTQGATTPGKEMDAMQRINDAVSADEIIRMIQSGNF